MGSSAPGKYFCHNAVNRSRSTMYIVDQISCSYKQFIIRLTCRIGEDERERRPGSSRDRSASRGRSLPRSSARGRRCWWRTAAGYCSEGRGGCVRLQLSLGRGGRAAKGSRSAEFLNPGITG
jgi:hypothetical protein